MMADAVGLALGCVGLSLLMSLSSACRGWPTCTVWLLHAVVLLCCSSMLQFHAAVPSHCTTSAALAAESRVREPWQFAIVSVCVSGCHYSSGDDHSFVDYCLCFVMKSFLVQFVNE